MHSRGVEMVTDRWEREGALLEGAGLALVGWRKETHQGQSRFSPEHLGECPVPLAELGVGTEGGRRFGGKFGS